MFLDVKIESSTAKDQGQQEEDKTEEPHQLHSSCTLSFITLANLNNFSGHVVNENNTYIGWKQTMLSNENHYNETTNLTKIVELD